MTLPGSSCAGTRTTGKPIRISSPADGFHPKRPKSSRTYGGCDFGADPHFAAQAQQIFWTPQVDPSAITFAAGPRPEGFCITADELRTRAIFQHDPAHLRLAIRGEQYDVTLADPQDGKPLAAMVIAFADVVQTGRLAAEQDDTSPAAREIAALAAEVTRIAT